MASELKAGERVLFRDGTGSKRVGVLEGPMDGPPADWLVRAEGGKNTWIRNEAELVLAPYPTGKWLPTEGFDVTRMPEQSRWNTTPVVLEEGDGGYVQAQFNGRQFNTDRTWNADGDEVYYDIKEVKTLFARFFIIPNPPAK